MNRATWTLVQTSDDLWDCSSASHCMRYVISSVRLCATPWTVAHQVPLFMGFSRQEYWTGLAYLSPGYFPDSGIEPASLTSPALAGVIFTASAPGKPSVCCLVVPTPAEHCRDKAKNISSTKSCRAYPNLQTSGNKLHNNKQY